MEFKIEEAGETKLANITVSKLCRFHGGAIPKEQLCIKTEIEVTDFGYTKDKFTIVLCRTCTKQLAKFFDDNRSAIISM